MMVPAIFIEAAHFWSPILKGAVAGLLGGAIFYFSARYFIDVPNFYGSHEIGIALISCTIGGLLAGVVAQKFYRKV